MPHIITPTTLWSDFDDTLDLCAEKLSEESQNGIKVAEVTFLGRETGAGRVKVYGVYAFDEATPSADTVIIFPDSSDGIDKALLEMFVKKGYSALMVDYRGEWDGEQRFTVYPENIEYANTLKCGRKKEDVDESADKTSWYEWVAVGIYARKFAAQMSGSDNIAVRGIYGSTLPGNFFFQSALHGDVAGDLSMFPAGRIGSGLDNLGYELMRDGISLELADASAP